MEAMKEVAKALVQGIPAPQLRRVMTAFGSGVQLSEVESGDVCGSGCSGAGNVCGSGCLVSAGTMDAFDQQGRLGLTQKDFEEIRADLPSLRREITEELNSALNTIRTLQP